MNVPRVTFEQIVRPLLAIVIIFAFSGSLTQTAAATTEVRFYELPTSVRDARQACYEQAARDNDIPDGQAAYEAWWAVNQGTPAEQRWTAQFEACKVVNPMPGGKWNWDGMTLVRTEIWP
jgi:hypothetical protein